MKRRSPHTLKHAAAGATVRIAGFARETPEHVRERLLAYGLMPGQVVKVLARKPVILVQIEHTELALERLLASSVEVEPAAG